MKKKTIIIIISIIGFLLVVGGVSIIVYNQIHEKNVENRKIEKKILEDYEVFREKVDMFTQTRTIYHDEVIVNLFPESVEEEYESWITTIEQYTTSINEVESSSDNLKELCVNKYYSNEDVNNKCKSFVIAYETAINYYTKDIIAFNETIDEYHKVSLESKKGIINYELKYDYTDINADGNFVGKN